MKDKIVVNVVGGVVQAIWSNNSDIKVNLFDYDVFETQEKNESGYTKEEWEEKQSKLIKNMSEIYQRLKMKDKEFKVIGGFTVAETYETIIKAKNKEDAEKKALLLDLSKWDDCKSENMDSMSIDSVEELEDER